MKTIDGISDHRKIQHGNIQNLKDNQKPLSRLANKTGSLAEEARRLQILVEEQEAVREDEQDRRIFKLLSGASALLSILLLLPTLGASSAGFAASAYYWDKASKLNPRKDYEELP